ncbi:protein jag [Laspinema olomoucense]|uniref:RNA-binding protein n=1 Tax=Laspinema olomoucense D3b TaxID=2953688 RepID=A0ABT2NB35_9CYAN|nr:MULTISPECIES: R3H domain-containing nucleic acid-binding protein [unclassified Laspinema]MCT7974217.1 RNA-binding protein [Laspinema sp. D3d]MCT7979916.1 RNA-binding protein [Laspinema sp. D3b]MCT7990248.1 RNA-binding protein [Laspinema sp. D3a]
MVSPTQSPMQRGQQWIEQLLKLLRIDSSVTTQEQEDSFWLTIDEKNLTPEQIEILTGPNGQVLDAIQYLANTTLNIAQPTDVQASYTIELNQYRVRREEVLREMVAKAVQTVQETGEAYEMKGLSSAERRQVHNLLKDYEDLESFSRGQEPDRRLVVHRRETV